MVRPTPVKQTTEAESESPPDMLPIQKQPESSTTPLLELVPIDEVAGWCSNCGDRLAYDHMNGHPVCPIQESRCPRHQG